jgi:hypothetical protein
MTATRARASIIDKATAPIGERLEKYITVRIEPKITLWPRPAMGKAVVDICFPSS